MVLEYSDDNRNQLDQTDDIFQRHSEYTAINCFGKGLIQFCYPFHVVPFSGLLQGDVCGKKIFRDKK